jgi:hypothetical protein
MIWKNIVLKQKMSSRTDRLLCCAVAYLKSDVEEKPIPKITKNTSVSDVVESMMNVLWVEAKENMKETMTDVPTDPYLHAVDIGSEEPGIVASKTKIDIHRRKLPLPNVTYSVRTPIMSQMDIPPDVCFEKACLDAEKYRNKSLCSIQKAAKKDLKNEYASIEKIKRREEAKEKRKNETKEEREERLLASREKKALKKAEKEAKALEEEQSRENEEEQSHGQEQSIVENKGEKADSSEVQEISVEKNLPDSVDADLKNVAVDIQELLESEASADTRLHSLLPTRVKAKSSKKTKFHPSPVPFDRHLVALEATCPNEHIANVLIGCEYDSRVRIIQGPPGTGKTYSLIKELEKYPDERIFVCSPTNVGIAALYVRLLKAGHSCSLLMPRSRIPSGTPVTSQDPNARIVCSTISGRSGPILDAQEFEVILVDEAAQCMEACFWGLIRPSVNYITMVGDTAQLPALVSECGRKLGYDKSLMQRLMESNYPYDFLNVQRRMHPDIVQYPNKLFYENRLKTEYTNSDDISCEPYKLYNMKRGECKEIGTSFVNDTEAKYCVELAIDLKKQSTDVVIICPYQAQARQILSYGADVEVHTVDSFQGREADIVILSVVRTKSCGFWADPRRLCVALTRAKHSLQIVGTCESWCDTLHNLYTDAKERNIVCLLE